MTIYCLTDSSAGQGMQYGRMKTTAVACLMMVAIAGSADAVRCLPCLAVVVEPRFVAFHTFFALVWRGGSFLCIPPSDEKTTGNFQANAWPHVASDSETIPKYLALCRPGNMAAKLPSKPLLALHRRPVR